jgi:hypothetical protein
LERFVLKLLFSFARKALALQSAGREDSLNDHQRLSKLPKSETIISRKSLSAENFSKRHYQPKKLMITLDKPDILSAIMDDENVGAFWLHA